LPMAARIIQSGTPVQGFDLSAQRLALAAEIGVTTHPTLAEAVAGCDLVFVSIPDDRALISLCLESGELIRHMLPGSTLIETSTVSVEASARVAEAATAHGVVYLRSPVSGNPVAAEAGTISAMVSGPREALEAAKPVFAAFTKAQYWLGDEEQARQAMERLAQELEQLAQQQQGQEIREAAAQGLEQLQQALSDDSNQLQAATDEMASGDQAAAGMPQPGTQDPDALSMQAAEAGAQSAEQGQGDLSVPGAGDEIEYGAPTTLEVELLPESMELAPQSGDEPGEQLIDQPSQAEESKLEYQPVESDVTYGEADLLKANTIPLSYRALIKRYFQAVGPRGQHDY